MFGRLRVLFRDGKTRQGAACWRVRCSCGVEKTIRGSTLTDGCARSCGCLAQEVRKTLHLTHGATKTFEFSAWMSMRRRCTDPKHIAFSRYGGAGIKVCKRWAKFEAFLEDMGPCPFEKGSVERLDNHKGYTPANCKWLPRGAQSKNRKGVLLFEGRTVPELAETHGIKYSTLMRRVKAGWPRARWFDNPKH